MNTRNNCKYRNISVPNEDYEKVSQMLKDEGIAFINDVFIKLKPQRDDSSKAIYEFVRCKGFKNVQEGVIFFGGYRELKKAFNEFLEINE